MVGRGCTKVHLYFQRDAVTQQEIPSNAGLCFSYAMQHMQEYTIHSNTRQEYIHMHKCALTQHADIFNGAIVQVESFWDR